jgi:hypothetical protein
MGNIYFVACLNCKQTISLGKYWDWKPSIREDISLEKAIEEHIKYLNDENERYSKQPDGVHYKDQWIEAALVLHWFLASHNEHKIWVGHDNDPFMDQYRDRHGHSFFDDYELLKEQ